MIRGARLDEALNICKFSPQVAVSEDLYSLLNSAFANAKQKNPNIRDAKELWVAEALVDEALSPTCPRSWLSDPQAFEPDLSRALR
jgi:ribosomal protein L22